MKQESNKIFLKFPQNQEDSPRSTNLDLLISPNPQTKSSNQSIPSAQPTQKAAFLNICNIVVS